MQDIASAAPHQIQAAIAACRDPAELDMIADRAMAKWPDLAKAARRRSAAFKAHASRQGGVQRLARPVAARPARAVLASSTHLVLVVRDGMCMERVFDDVVTARAFAHKQQIGLLCGTRFADEALAAPVALAPTSRKVTKLVTTCSIAPPGNWLCGQRSVKLEKLALAEWAAMPPARQQWHLAAYAAGTGNLPKPAALAEADRADMAQRNADHAARARFWREHEKEQQIIGNIWISGDLRSAAVLAQPRGQYTKNTAANEKLVRRVSRWMGAARRIAAECVTDADKAAFQTRMRKLQARRKASEAAKLTNSTKKAA